MTRPLPHPALEAYLAEQFQAAEADLRQIQREKAGFQILMLALASLIGFLIGLMVAA
jgi:hypothetical protein